MSSNHIDGSFRFTLREYVYRDTARNGRKRYTLVEAIGGRNHGNAATVVVEVSTITDYQYQRYHHGRRIGYASFRLAEGAAQFENAYRQSWDKMRAPDGLFGHEPSRVLVRHLATRMQDMVKREVMGAL